LKSSNSGGDCTPQPLFKIVNDKAKFIVSASIVTSVVAGPVAGVRTSSIRAIG